MPKPEKVLVYIGDFDFDGGNVASTSLSIKSAYHIGETNSGLKYRNGQVFEIEWDDLLKYSPTIVEIAFSKAEFESLIEVLEENYEDYEILQYFERVRQLSLHSIDIRVESLLKLFKWFPLLGIFSFSNLNFSKNEWNQIISALSRVEIRGIEISDNILPEIEKNLNIAFMKLTEHPGVNFMEFKKNLEFITVKGIFAQGILQNTDDVAEQFLSSLDASFPRLKILIFDWNIVNTEVLFDDRTRGIIDRLVKLYENLKLDAIAIIAYTPDLPTKSAMTNFSETFGNRIQSSNIDLVQFGTTEGVRNLSLLTICENHEKKDLFYEIFVKNKTANPSMMSLLHLVGENLSSSIPQQHIEFAGFQNESIRRIYENVE